MTGTIAKLPEGKSFGFISAEGLEKDLFFHQSAVVGVSFTDLRQGDAVSFDKEESAKGWNAINVQKV